MGRTQPVDQLELPGTTARITPRAGAKPILRWCGGKTWIVDILARGVQRRLARTGGRYIEPFLGGAALALDLGLPNMILGDACTPLIEMYQMVVRQPGPVAWALSALASQGVDESSYYRVRDSRPAALVMKAARFVYLNRLCFNGVYRENAAGDFNVPYGDVVYRASMVNRKGGGKSGGDAIGSLFPHAGKLHDVARAFATADLKAQDFRGTLARAEPGDLVYADPPYAGTFDAYTAEGFGAHDQEALAHALHEHARRGVTVATTNSDCPEIRKLYTWAPHVLPTAELRAVNSDGGNRRRAGCLLITNDLDIVGVK